MMYTAGGVIFLLMLLQTSGHVLKETGVHGLEDNLDSAHDIQEDALEPSDYLSFVHEPSSRESLIHHLSKSLLTVTRDLLSFTPRSKNVFPNLMLERLRQLHPRDVDALLQEKGVVLPPLLGVGCDPNSQFYRTMDGSCNNPVHPCWGKADEPYQRWLQPVYANGVDEPRRREDGLPLPSPRQVYQWVSSQFQQTANTTYSQITNLVTVWGQMIAHDMILTPTVTVKVWDGKELKDEVPHCCNRRTTSHPDCIPIVMEYEDGFYPRGHCMDIARSAAHAFSPFSCTQFKLGQPRQQMNQLTSFIDASLVYGVSEQDTKNLREHGGQGAKLMTDHSSGYDCPPRKNRACKVSHKVCDNRCFLAGEKRANENPILSAFHTVWVREHNRLVDALRGRHWPEETLFHVVRKIVGALMQHITYKEYLPVILGPSLVQWLHLAVPSSASYRYDPSVNPGVYNVFATAAFRYGHSMVDSRLVREGRTYSGSPLLSSDFFSMDEFCDPHRDPVATLLSGQAAQRPQKVDCLFSQQLTNHLFSKDVNGPGLDLFSVNIQRGRDHGLPPYIRWREVCGLPPVRDYPDLRGTIPDYVIDRMATIYGPGGVKEVDLYVGGISEFPVNGGIMGPTFTCIISNQFRVLKFGDRFWYENKDHPGKFTKDQISSIQKTSLSSLICRNSDIKEIQRLAFIVESSTNPKLPCDVIRSDTDLDLNLWL